MSFNLSALSDVQKTIETEVQEQVAGAGQQANYLMSEIPKSLPIDTTDKAECSFATSVNGSKLLRVITAVKEDGEQYLENSSEYIKHMWPGQKNKNTDGVSASSNSSSDSQALENGEEEYTLTQDPTTGKWILTDAQGNTRTFNSKSEAEAYCRQESSDHPGTTIVVRNADGSTDSVYAYGRAEGEDDRPLEGDQEDYSAEAAEQQDRINNPDDQNPYANSWDDDGGASAGSGSTSRTTGTGNTGRTNSHGATNGIDAASDLDNQATAHVMGFNDDDYVTTEDGYLVPNEEKLKAWEKRLIELANALGSLLVMLSSGSDARKISDEVFTGVATPDDKNSAKQAYSRKIAFLMKMASTAIGKLFEKINTENQKRYNEQMEKLTTDKNVGSGNKLLGRLAVFAARDRIDAGPPPLPLSDPDDGNGNTYEDLDGDGTKETKVNSGYHYEDTNGDGRKDTEIQDGWHYDQKKGKIVNDSDPNNEDYEHRDQYWSDGTKKTDENTTVNGDDARSHCAPTVEESDDFISDAGAEWNDVRSGKKKPHPPSPDTVVDDITHLRTPRGSEDDPFNPIGVVNTLIDGPTGILTMKETQDKEDEAQRYAKATEKTLRVMQSLIQALIQLLLVSFAEGEMNTMALGMVASLTNLNNKIDAICKKIDKNNRKIDIEEAPRRSPERVARGIMHGDNPADIIDGEIEAGNEFVENMSNVDPKEVLEDEGTRIKNWPLERINGLAELFGQEPPFKIKDPYYIDDLNISEIISEWRAALVANSNLIRAYMSLKFMKSDLRNVAMEKFTERQGIKNNAEILMQSAESVLGLATRVFDATTTQMMIGIRTNNTLVQLNKALQQNRLSQPLRMMAAALTASALVTAGFTVGLAIFLVIYTGGLSVLVSCAVIFALLGAMTAAEVGVAGVASGAAAFVAADVESYTPEDASADSSETGRKGHGETALESIENIDNEEKANTRAMARSNGVYGYTGDGYLYIDNKKMAAYEMRQKMLDNALRCVFSLLKNSRDLRRVADAEFTGSSIADSGGSLLQNMVENNIMQRQMLTTAIKFQHQEVVNAQNAAHAAEINRLKASAQIAIGLFTVATSLGVAIASVALMPWAWAVAGVAAVGIGVSLGSSFTSLLLSIPALAANLPLSMENSNELQNMLRKKGGDSTESRLDEAEYAAYEDILNNGTVNTTAMGALGYQSVNYSFITEIYARLGRIYAAKEALAKARALSSELRQIAKQEFSGTSLGTIGELTNSVNQASFNTAMRVAGSLVNALQTKVTVHNRAVDANKQFAQAAVTLAVNTAIAAIGAGTIGFSIVNSMSSSFICMLAKTVTTPLMSLVSSANSLAFSVVDSLPILGQYQNYNAKTTVDKTGRKVQNARTVDDKMDQQEYAIMAEMNAGMVESLDSSMTAVSPFASKLNARMKALYNVRQAVAIARSLTNDSLATAKRAFTGKTINNADFGGQSLEIFKEVAMSMLSSLQKLLETIAERNTQIEEARKQVLLSSISVALNTVSLMISVVSTSIESSVKTEIAKTDPTKAPEAGKTPASTTPSPVSTGQTAPVATAEGVVDVDYGQMAKELNAAGVTAAKFVNEKNAKIAQNIILPLMHCKNDSQEIQAMLKGFERASTFLSLASNFISATDGLIYDAVHNEFSPKAKEAKAGKSLDTKKTSGKNGEKKDYFDSQSDMDADIDEAEYLMMMMATKEQLRQINAARLTPLWDSFINEAKSLSSTISALAPNAKEPVTKIDPKKREDELTKRAAAVAGATKAQAPGQLAPKMPAVENSAPSHANLLAHAQMIEESNKQLEACEAAFDKEIEGVNSEITALEAPKKHATPEALNERIKELKDKRDVLVAMKADLTKQRLTRQEELKLKLAELKAMDTKLEATGDNIESRAKAIAEKMRTNPNDETLTAEELGKLADDWRENKEKLEMQQAAKNVLKESLMKTEDELIKINARKDELFNAMKGLSGEIIEVNKQIAQLERESAAQSKSPTSAVPQNANNATMLADLLGIFKIGQKTAAKSLDNVSEDDKPKAGEIVASIFGDEKSATPKVLAMSGASPTRHGGQAGYFADYQKAVQDEEKYLKHVGGMIS